MIRTISSALSAALLACAATTAAAQAGFTQTTLSFDDLAPTGIGGAVVPTGYGGFNFGVLGPTFYITQPAPQGAAVDNHVAFSSTSSFLYMRTDRSAFYLDSVDFFSRRAVDAVGDVYLVLYRDGATVYNGRVEKDGRNVFTATRTAFRPMVYDEDTKTSSAFTGPIDGFALAFDNDDHDHLAMDNLQLRVLAAVPEPETHALMLTGLLLVAATARRRRQTAAAR